MASYLGRRKFLATLGGAAAAGPLAARAQQTDRMRRIAVLMGIANELEGQKRVTAFRQGLQAAGWAEGLNVRIDYHWVGGDADRARRPKPRHHPAKGNRRHRSAPLAHEDISSGFLFALETAQGAKLDAGQ